MKKIILPSLLMTQLSIANVFADNELKTSDVFVTATRTPIAKNNVIADTTIISQEDIERAGSSSLQELLQRQPGIEVSNTGGMGKVTTIGIRGTSSTHSIILIDGMRVNAATSGFTAIEHIPLSQIEKIEILRGSASSLYGQDAIGGVIQIFTKKGVAGFKPYIGIGYGSYNTSNFQSGIRGGNNQTTYAINFAAMNTDSFSALAHNPLAFEFDPYIGDKDGYRNKSISSSLSHKINENYKIDFMYYLTKGNNNFDNRYSAAEFTNFKNETKQQILATSVAGQINSIWKTSIKIGQTTDKYLDKQKYDLFSPGYYNPNLNDLYQTIQNQFAWQNDIKLPIGSLTLLYDRLTQEIKTTDLYEKTKRINNGYMIGYLVNHDKHNLQTNIRTDLNSVYENSTTQNIGYAYSIKPNWTVTASYGTAFVSPSFNYLYALSDKAAYGNPNLKPEKSENIEGSLRYRDDSSSISLTAFRNEINDFIIYNSTNPVNYSRTNTTNLNKASIQGFTVSADHFFGHFQIKGSLTNQTAKNTDTDKYLPYRSTVLGNLNLNYYIDNWNIGIETTGSGTRYSDKENTRKISGYILTNLVADYKISEQLKFNLRLNNALDKNYTLAYEGDPNGPIINDPDWGPYSTAGFKYKTPGRSLFANLRYDF
jgi:vitamin B12 transporter